MRHTHVQVDSRDCDGRQSRSYVASYASREEAIEMHEPNPGSGGTVIAGEYHVYISEPTEEGYRKTKLTFCTDVHCTGTYESYRDHAAEAMGY